QDGSTPMGSPDGGGSSTTPTSGGGGGDEDTGVATTPDDTGSGGGDDTATGPEDTAMSPEDEPPPAVTPGEPIDRESAGGIYTCSADDLVPPWSAARRVKYLLTGMSVTEAEMQQAIDDPDSALHGLVQEWVETDEFMDKMSDFLQVTLQQAEYNSGGLGNGKYANMVRGRMNATISLSSQMSNTLNTSFTRTALDAIASEQPFNTIAHTQTWMMTTAMMSYMLAVDHGPRVTEPIEARVYKEPFSDNGVQFNADTPAAVQLEHMTFYAANLRDRDNQNQPCASDPYTVNVFEANRNDHNRRNYQHLNAILLRSDRLPNSHDCNIGGVTHFRDSDFTDWRPVTMVPLAPGEEPLHMADSNALRRTNELKMHTPRAGFFTHPSFLVSWETNEDNSFRVTTNQMLIVGLGLAFEDTDVTTPLGDEGLADEHASPGTECYNCHKNLDPMRNHFANVFEPESYGIASMDNAFVTPSFSFQGHTDAGEDLASLGWAVANHPHFAEGWVQKLCMFANSQPCDAYDPELARIVAAFEGSNFNFKTLIVELFSSPLVTGSACAQGVDTAPVTTSIARRNHLCGAISIRLGIDNACGLTGTIRDISAALPSDAWSRGSTTPDQPALPSMFYELGTDALCRYMASRVVNVEGSPLQSSDMEGSLDALVTDLMGLPPSDPRHAPIRAELANLVSEASDVVGSTSRQLQNAFIVACKSPAVTSTDL
ncbi:MAG: hypothetical protein AAFS10_18115, partial [Myxococcota bacterium]